MVVFGRALSPGEDCADVAPVDAESGVEVVLEAPVDAEAVRCAAAVERYRRRLEVCELEHEVRVELLLSTGQLDANFFRSDRRFGELNAAAGEHVLLAGGGVAEPGGGLAQFTDELIRPRLVCVNSYK